MNAPRKNPLIRDRDVDFLLYDVLDATKLTSLPYFADHDRETFDMALGSARKFAREVLFPSYRVMDQEPPRLVDGRVLVHPKLKEIYPALSDLGLYRASRPVSVGGQQLPLLVSTFASAYLMAGNLNAYGLGGLAVGAAHLLEAFGSPELQATYMAPIYEGRWLGTMALTEPHAGSSLADVATRATKAEDESYRISGSKLFISGGDHDLTDNIVHMVLARIEGAPLGTKGVSLFCVPKRRAVPGTDAKFVDNDVSVTGLVHKIGWRGIPACALSFGERGDCHGFLVGEPNRGLSYMFQMMNEARIWIGVNGAATASVAFHEACIYAESRPQGRKVTSKDPSSPQVPIVEHADVRRMLLRQKAIVEGALALVGQTSLYADLSEHAEDTGTRASARTLLDLLTPIAKSFPAERGFEANTLALQVHGGYGYSSEYLPEAWLRDQKLNSIHEGTTGIQALDLLGRKVMADGGAALGALHAEVTRTLSDARAAGLDPSWTGAIEASFGELIRLTMHLGTRGATGDVDGMLLHSSDYLDLFSALVVSWLHLKMAAAAKRKLALGGEEGELAFLRGKLLGAEYWIRTEVPRANMLMALCLSGEDSYGRVTAAEL